MTVLPLGDVKSHLSELVGRVHDHHERVTVTVHGRPSAVLIAPEDLVKLKRIQRFSLVLPTRNISLRGMSLRRSVRATLQEFFTKQPADGLPFITSLRWLLFRQWTGTAPVLLSTTTLTSADTGTTREAEAITEHAVEEWSLAKEPPQHVGQPANDFGNGRN